MPAKFEVSDNIENIQTQSNTGWSGSAHQRSPDSEVLYPQAIDEFAHFCACAVIFLAEDVLIFGSSLENLSCDAQLLPLNADFCRF